MTEIIERVTWPAVLLAVALVLAACGNGGDASESVADPDPPDADEGADPAPDPVPDPDSDTGDDDDEADPDPEADGIDEQALEALVAAAQEEGALVWYNAYAPAPSEALAAAFTETYGIDVEYIRLTTGPLTQRFATESEAGTHTADVLTISGPLFFAEGIDNGWIATLDESDIPALAEWPEEGWELDAYATVSANPILFAWNTDRVSPEDVPDTWEDLLDPRWQGEIIIPDVRTVPSWLAQAYLLHEEYGPAFLEGLRDQDLMLVDSVVPGSQALGAGERSILMMVNLGVLSTVQDEGAPVDYKVIEPTSGLEIQSALSANAPNPNAARLFQHFSMTEAGQIALNEGSGASLLGDLPGALTLPDGYVPPAYVESTEMASVLAELLGIQ